MIAVDINILVYAHREDSEWYHAADECLTELAESGIPWAIPWPCIHEFVAMFQWHRCGTEVLGNLLVNVDLRG